MHNSITYVLVVYAELISLKNFIWFCCKIITNYAKLLQDTLIQQSFTVLKSVHKNFDAKIKNKINHSLGYIDKCTYYVICYILVVGFIGLPSLFHTNSFQCCLCLLEP